MIKYETQVIMENLMYISTELHRILDTCNYFTANIIWIIKR